MSGYSTSFDKKVTVGDLKKFLEQCPDDYLVEVLSSPWTMRSLILGIRP